MSVFDPESFKHSSVGTSFATRPPLPPEGEWTAYIESVDGRIIDTKDGERAACNIRYRLEDEQIMKEMERSKPPTVTQLVFLDLDEGGQLSQEGNDNWQLGQIREAAEQNDDPEWMPAKLEGAGPLTVIISHRTFTREDGTEDTVANVRRVRAGSPF